MEGHGVAGLYFLYLTTYFEVDKGSPGGALHSGASIYSSGYPFFSIRG